MMRHQTLNLFCTLILVFLPTPIFASAVLALNIDDDEYFSETFTVFSDLENGAYIYGQIGVSNIGPGNKRGICRLLISHPNEKPVDQSLIVNQDEWTYTAQTQETLSVENCALSHNSKKNLLIFSGIINSQKIAMTLHASPQKRITPNGQLYTKSGYYLSDILVPWAVATVEYQFGDTQITSKGFGYADHSRSTMLPATIAHQWIRFRALNAKDSTIILARQPMKTSAFSGWVWNQKDESAHLFQKLDFSTNSDMLHSNIVINDESDQFSIKIDHEILRYAPLEGKGFLMKMISYAVGNPVTYTYRARLISSKGKETQGILEIAKINGE